MCIAKSDELTNTFSQTSHSCPLFLFPLFVVVVSFRISFCSTSKTTSSSSGIFKHNTGGCSSSSSTSSSSLSLASKYDTFKTVLAFTARCGCGFFRLMLLLVLLEVVHVVHVVLDLSFHQNEDFSSKRLFFSSWKKQFHFTSLLLLL
jgi:hypothetical protein